MLYDSRVHMDRTLVEFLPSSAHLQGGFFMTYFIGIDIAKYKHDCFIMDQYGSVIRDSFSFSNDSAGFSLLLSVLDSLEPSYEKRIGFESTGHYGLNLKCFLEEHDLSFMEINPILIKRFSSATTLRRTKTDKADAALIASYLTTVEYITYPTQSYHIRNLKSLTRSRDALVKLRSGQLVMITNVLDKIFPEFKPFFNKSLKSATALYLLRNYTVPSRMASMNSESYRKMASKLRRTISYAQFTKLRELAKHTVGREDACLTFELHTYLDIYWSLDSKIKEMETYIEEEFKKIRSHIQTIRGIGWISAASIYSEYGDIENFQTPNQMLAYAGLDPSRNESGEHAYNGHMVKHGSSHLRYVLLNCAEMVIVHDPVFYDYYRKKREEGKPHRVALSHVARKLIRIIFFLEKNNIDYDPKKMR